MDAILLIITKSGTKDRVATGLLYNPGIIDTYTVYGAYDIVARAKVEDIGRFQRILKDENPEIELITALVPDTDETDKAVRPRGVKNAA